MRRLIFKQEDLTQLPVPEAGFMAIAVSNSGSISTISDAGDIAPLSSQVFIGSATQSIDVVGDIEINSDGTTTIQPDSVTYDKMQDTTQAALLGNQSGAGTVGEIPIVEQYLNTGAITALLENPSNWTSKSYTGSAITGTFQGQKHYDGDYIFEAVDDNVWVRYSRV